MKRIKKMSKLGGCLMRGTRRFAYLLLESPLPHHAQITAELPSLDEVDDVGRPVDEAREILEREGMTS